LLTPWLDRLRPAGGRSAAPARVREAASSRLVLAATLTLGAAAGLVLRLVVWTSPLGQYESDEAVWGLMARHVLDGEVSAFFWGQAYGGTLEVLLTAPLFWIAGSGWIALRLVPIALTAVAAVLVWRVGRRTIGEPAAAVAAVVFWVFPFYLVWKSVRAHGFYGSGLVLTLLLLLLVLRLAERRSRLDAALLGLVLGVGLWQTAQIVAVALPALAWLTWRRPAAWRDAWAAVPAALLGALPWLVSNVRHDWWSLSVDAPAPSYLTRLRGGLSGTLPMALDLRLPFTSEWLGGKLVGGGAYVLLLAALAVLVWRRRRTSVTLLAAVAVVYPFVYAISTYTWLNDEPRYMVLLIPVLVLLLCLPVTTAARGAAAVLAAIGLSALSIALIDVDRYRVSADGHLVPREFAPLVDTLDRLGIRRVFGHYWITYRLTFETGERIVAADADTASLAERRPGAVLPELPYETRRSAYADEVKVVEAPAWVFRDGSTRDRRWRGLFARAGYERVVAGGFAVYHRGEASAGP
jgi:hypothetical protein